MRAFTPSVTLLTHLLRVGTYMFLNVCQLEHGQKLLKCQEKPRAVYTMQENVWRPGLCPGPRWGAYSATQIP